MKEEGFSSIELAFVVPVVALFLLILIQFSSAFHEAHMNTAKADARAAVLVREWEDANFNRGFLRPCIELVEPEIVHVDGEAVILGTGLFRGEFRFPQEMRIAAQPICSP